MRASSALLSRQQRIEVPDVREHGKAAAPIWVNFYRGSSEHAWQRRRSKAVLRPFPLRLDANER